MTPPSFFFAQIETLINQPVQKSVSTTVRDTFIIIGCALVLAAVLFGATYLYRKRKPHHHHHHYPDPKPLEDSEESAPSRRKSRRRRRKPDHPDKRPRNPTLSETGGLPPMRQETED